MQTEFMRRICSKLGPVAPLLSIFDPGSVLSAVVAKLSMIEAFFYSLIKVSVHSDIKMIKMSI